FIEECKEFASWGLRPPLLTIPMSDSYISFYEVMSYVTHLLAKLWDEDCDAKLSDTELEQMYEDLHV
ncbi:hypothetical protein TELCIR_25547, partial [Teladorsagia circumcincta]